MEEIIKIECTNCGATGIYKGMGERDGAGVICSNCEGKGYVIFRFNRFKQKKNREDISRVYKSGHGYCISDQDVIKEDGSLIRFSKFGCTYEDWKNGKQPLEIEDLVCPYLANNRGMGNEPLQRCRELCRFGFINECKFFNQKHICWDEFKEQKK